MKREVCAVRDRASDSFGAPMFVQAIGIAERSFTDEINRSDQANQLYMHPEDFDLYYLGSFDDSNAKFDLLETPKMIRIGKDCVRQG